MLAVFFFYGVLIIEHLLLTALHLLLNLIHLIKLYIPPRLLPEHVVGIIIRLIATLLRPLAGHVGGATGVFIIICIQTLDGDLVLFYGYFVQRLQYRLISMSLAAIFANVHVVCRVHKIKMLLFQPQRRVGADDQLLVVYYYVHVGLLHLPRRRPMTPLKHLIDPGGHRNWQKTALALIILLHKMISNIRSGVICQWDARPSTLILIILLTAVTLHLLHLIKINRILRCPAILVVGIAEFLDLHLRQLIHRLLRLRVPRYRWLSGDVVALLFSCRRLIILHPPAILS